ncbi:hypothetical protein HanIR_Chr09g0410911 [Helianthus annuus]|nr:hypothetical protein HanIR_Chr09g0410911 [Helianthus annuus]
MLHCPKGICTSVKKVFELDFRGASLPKRYIYISEKGQEVEFLDFSEKRPAS